MVSTTVQKTYICTNISRLSHEEKKNLIHIFFMANGLDAMLKSNADSMSVDLNLLNDDKLIESIYCYVEEICRRHTA